MEITTLSEFRSQSIHRISLNTPRVITCLEAITEEQAWKRPNSASNSIANLVLHLCGNMTQYVISSLGQTPDHRDRDAEFSAQGGITRTQLANKLRDTVNRVLDVIADVPEPELLRVRSVQGFSYSGVGIVIHVTEHYSYHTGQIALLTKLFTNRDLGFYSGMDLNRKNTL
jgi:uncharacterized damage-inducible protein DinB